MAEILVHFLILFYPILDRVLAAKSMNKRTNFLLYISQTFRTITSLAAIALRHTLIGIHVLVPTWYSIRESNSVLYLERVATQPICLMEYN